MHYLTVVFQGYHEGMFSELGYDVMAQRKDNMAVFREAVRLLSPDAK
jgi:hypothetical protein